ncbi:MAG: hypothetical protein SXQ77_13435, partial [Halobacteria archaeon]|nr:hypothetical protein [Halobacteria archaeon]
MPIRDKYSDEIDRLVDSINRLTANMETEIESGVNKIGSRLMAVDIIDRRGELEIVADMPGFEKDDIEVRGDDGSI